jgi:hypothetical protein
VYNFVQHNAEKSYRTGAQPDVYWPIQKSKNGT